MELVYENKLVHFIGSHEAEGDGERWYSFAFRDSSGEKFVIRLRQTDVPNTFFGCTGSALEKALQQILDQHARQLQG